VKTSNPTSNRVISIWFSPFWSLCKKLYEVEISLVMMKWKQQCKNIPRPK
jgi:hypothetical protein